MPAIELLVIGHVTRDITPSGLRSAELTPSRLGGAVTYAALTAYRLGYRVAVLTAASDDLRHEMETTLAGIHTHCIPSPTTTTFTHIYQQGHRTQAVADIAVPIVKAYLTKADQEAPVVLLGPVAAEISIELIQSFPHSLLGLCLQGWLRCWDSAGQVRPCPWPEATEALPLAQAAFVSEEDVASMPDAIDEFAQRSPLLVVTRGERGLDWHQRGWHHQPAFHAACVDPTGAGDVLAAAFLLRLAETGNPEEAARFGACTASFCVEAAGAAGLPSRRQVEARLAGW